MPATLRLVTEIMEASFERQRELKIAGNKEYAHSEDNDLANFEIIAELVGITPEQCLMVYWLKHTFGILAHVKGHTSQREDVLGRVDDCDVYSHLFKAMVISKRGTPTNSAMIDIPVNPETGDIILSPSPDNK